MDNGMYTYHVADHNADDLRLSRYIDYLNHERKKYRAEFIGNQFLIWENEHPNAAVLTDHLEYIEAGSSGRLWTCTYDTATRLFTHISADEKKEKRVFRGMHYVGWDGCGFWCYVPLWYDNDQNPIILRAAKDYDEYLKQMQMYRDMDEASNMASGVILTEEEKAVDAYIQQLYADAMNDKYVKAIRNGGKKEASAEPLYYPPLHPFYDAKQKLQENPSTPSARLFQVIRQMPKGGNLHIHTSATLSIEALMKLLADFDGAAGDAGEKWEVYVQQEDIAAEGKTVSYKNTLYLVNNIEAKQVQQSYKRFAELTENEKADLAGDLCFMDDAKVKGTDYIWDAFNRAFARVSPILKVKAFYVAYYIRAFREQIADKVDYVELRCGTPKFNDHTGDIVFGNAETAETAQETDNPFAVMRDIYHTIRQESPDFKLKLIVAGTRQTEPELVVEQIKLVHKYMDPEDELNADEEEKNFIIGYDLVGEEDRGKKTADYAEAILSSEEAKEVPYYFHDGESCWADDDNVYAAFVLGTRRVGHGLNMYRFPSMIRQMADKKVALEVCPVSNQLLRYTSDLRMHPLGEFINYGVPCVICSDDPLILGNPGLSYDFWEICLGQLLNLREIKKLILNSYQYSGMREEEKQDKIRQWNIKWSEFIKWVTERM